jgi:hypothetical protein
MTPNEHDPLAGAWADIAQTLRDQGDLVGAEIAGRPWGTALSSEHEPPPDYEKYRRQVLWKRIKARILERDAGTCRRCEGRASVVHHRSYADKVMRGEADEWLVSLCDGCHTVVHRDERGVWRTWEESERVLATPDAARSYSRPVIDLRRKWPEPPPEWERMNAHQRAGWHREAYQRFYAGLALTGSGRSAVGLIGLCSLETGTVPKSRDAAWRSLWIERAREIVATYRPDRARAKK